MTLYDKLPALGLLKNEIKVYLALLELGSTTTEPIKKKTKLSASKVYETLYRLVDKGLVSFAIINKKRHFQATPPERLLDIIQQKRKGLDVEESTVKSLLPYLKQLHKSNGTEKVIWMYQGLEGAKAAIADTFSHVKPGDEICVMGVRHGIRHGIEEVTTGDKMTAKVIDNYVKNLARNNIRERVICNSAVKQKILKQFGKIKTTKMRFLDQNTPATVRIFGNHVSIADFGPSPAQTTMYEIESPNVAKTFREFFELMWKAAKP
jgi:sugar-specific transcriptional regulator TrmB